MSIGAKFEGLLLDGYRTLLYNIDVIGLKYTVIVCENPVNTIAFIANKTSFDHLFFP